MGPCEMPSIWISAVIRLRPGLASAEARVQSVSSPCAPAWSMIDVKAL